VWRAARGIDPQDPRPTGGTQLETLPALWKQHLDRDIARATYPPADAGADERQTARAAPRRSYDNKQRPYQKGHGVRAVRPRPADSTPQSSHRGARNEVALHAAMERQAADCRICLYFQIKAPRVLLRAGLAPAFCGRGDVTQGRRAAGARARGACTRPAGCGRRRSGARSFRGRRPGSRRRCVLRPWPR
jgi:hypothetical protein